MDENQIRAMGIAIGQGMVAATQQRDNNTMVSRKQDSIRKAAASAPRFKISDNFNAFKLQYESWRRAVGILETVRIAAQQPEGNNPGHEAYDQIIHSAEFQAEQLVVQFVGPAAERIRAIGFGTPTWNQHIYNAELNEHARFDAYFLAVQELFLPAAESQMSKQQFLARRQRPDEDIAAYISDKVIYYNLAYSQVQRDQNFDFLRDKVVEGTFSNVIKKRLIENPPANEADLRAACTNYVAQERQKFLAGCSDSLTLDGLKATSRGAYEDAMDVQLNAMRQANREDECNRCHRKGHFAWECRQSWENIQSGQSRNGGQAAGMFHAQHHKSNQSQAPQGKSAARTAKKSRVECRYCHIRGHIEAECRKKKAAAGAGGAGRGRGGPPGRAGQSRGGAHRGGGRRQGGVHDLGEEEDPDSGYTALEEEDGNPFLEVMGEN